MPKGIMNCRFSTARKPSTYIIPALVTKTRVVRLTPKQLQRDSINVSFRMRKNEFLKDEATGKTYGLFVDDGMNHLGLYDPEAGTVGMGQKASKKIYPRVFKVHGGYAYSVFFDSGSNRGVISRVRME